MSSQANLSRLPEETIREIFSSFNEEDPADSSALRACSLVCQALLSPSQAILFSKIFLFSEETYTHDQGRQLNTQRIEDFHTILQAKPYLAAYVRELHLGINYDDTNWISQGHFIHIMERIQENNSLQTLRLYDRNTNRFEDTLVSETSALERFVAPLIRRLEISHLKGLPTSLLKSCANMKELLLMQSTFNSSICTSNGSEIAGPATRSKIQIEYLEYDSSPRIIRMLLNSEDPANMLPNLCRLRILKTCPLWPENMGHLQCILQSCAETLEELHLKVSVHLFPFSLSSINLSSMLSLRILDLHVKVGPTWDRTDPFPGLSKFLGTIPGNNSIKRIVLAVQIEIEKMDNFEPFFDVQWELLGRQLTRISSGKSLELYLDLVYIPQVIMSDDAPEAQEKAFLEECKSTFDRVVYGKRLQDTPQITIDVLHDIIRQADDYGNILGD